ncbi:unnamed protein product [Adineta steineri]|uniref:K Homology domain-containing protein n=1 Tax=Adineta steineri TaxID=433720 RepID=A0A813ZPG1_9BILA|nr:unnamed protein product [Adineta steineri]CAF0949853.1 unnamed protein product [Adineta steineri]
MTSSDDDYGQVSNNNTNSNRRMNSNSNNPYSSASGIEIRLLMTSRDAGAVIGKGGLAIQKLRADHPRIIIQVPDCASPERVLILSGEQDQCFDALYQIIPNLIDSSRLSSFNRRRNTTPGGGNSEEIQPNTNDEPIASEIRILVHQIYCGAIIGKGGQHVKELRQTYNLDIKVFSQCCPLSHERVISLRGKTEEIIECIKDIYNLMATSSQQPRGSPLIQYDPHNFDIYAVNEYGGFQPPGGVDNRSSYNPRGGGGGGGGGYSSTAQRGGMYPIQPLPPLVDVSYGGGPGLNARYNNTALLTSTRVTLPNELVGAIIGPRGAKIQQIRQTTNANIIIDDQSIPSGNSGGGDRIITIEGTPEQISRAQALLQQAVRQSGLWRP